MPRSIERLTGVVLLAVLWQLATATGVLSVQTLAAPSTVVRSAWHLLQVGTLGSAMWVSLKRVVVGLLIGVPVAALLALVAGLSRAGEDLVDTPMQMLR
ncbi:MAG TPA: hypothetical protein VMU14_24170, partial [Acidimicrobiales bacterium]|nr:hypothetical protein [Acidimicrobiales bacterium]